MDDVLVEDARCCTGRNLERQRPGRARKALRFLVPGRCGGCGQPAPDALCARCVRTVRRAPANAPARAAVAYRGAVREALRRAKFRRELGALRALLPLLPGALAAPAGTEGVCFVPLHRRRLLDRGFDPAAVVAAWLARAWGLPLLPGALVCRRLDAPLSHGVDAARRARLVAGRYRASARVEGARLVLVDDIVTTGATLREAARTLRRAGAAEVEPVALVATP